MFGATTYKIISKTPFTVEYRNGDLYKTIRYSVVLLPQEIKSEMPYIVFDIPENELHGEIGHLYTDDDGSDAHFGCRSYD